MPSAARTRTSSASIIARPRRRSMVVAQADAACHERPGGSNGRPADLPSSRRFAGGRLEAPRRCRRERTAAPSAPAAASTSPSTVGERQDIGRLVAPAKVGSTRCNARIVRSAAGRLRPLRRDRRCPRAAAKAAAAAAARQSSSTSGSAVRPGRRLGDHTPGQDRRRPSFPTFRFILGSHPHPLLGPLVGADDAGHQRMADDVGIGELDEGDARRRLRRISSA